MDRRTRLPIAVLLALATTVGFTTGAPAATAAPKPLSWQENLTQPVHRTGAAYGLETLASHTLPTAVNQVHVSISDTVPRGARVTVDVRGRRSDSTWTEWTPTLSAPATVVQVRLTLWDNAAGQSPDIHAVHVSTTTAKSSVVDGPHAQAQETYQVFATREGLVGGTTANGHVIVDNDHFVALPAGSALSDDGSYDYSVQVCGPSACETAPVWDIGPWNLYDDYWDANRSEFTDLDQGTPEAQAAYDDGYNGGYDDMGGQPSNPAGIDLADGTFYDVGLDDNGYVTVTYLWT